MLQLFDPQALRYCKVHDDQPLRLAQRAEHTPHGRGPFAVDAVWHVAVLSCTWCLFQCSLCVVHAMAV